ncbi:tetratricopeptide repeat protein 28-like [Pocillopora verrucosa]|uniref:tetratricopeptide repeat protein 28-like n=1 Tax=Pocillopora verrucosa TaxID=203993 RepID=UPI00333E39A8
MATARGPVNEPCENEDLPDKENALDFDENTLQADVYRNQGNEAFKRGEFINAIHFYTKGIKMNCDEKELKAKLYNNRAIAHFKLGNHQDSRRDAEAAIELNPTFLKAIVRGATACVELKRFEEAITWCDKGLLIDKNNRILLSLRLQSFREVGDKSMEEKDHITCSYDHGSASSGDLKRVIDFCNPGDKHREVDNYRNLGSAHYRLSNYKKAIKYYNLHLKIAKEVGDKYEEGNTYGNLGHAHFKLSDFKKAKEYHNLHLEIAKEVGDKHGESGAYRDLGNAHCSLGDFKTAIEYHNLHLKIAKEIGDKQWEGYAYCNLGSTYSTLGDLKKGIKYLNLSLEIAKGVGDKHGKGIIYGILCNTYCGLGEYKKATEYQNLQLKIVEEVGNKHEKSNVYCNIGKVSRSLGDFKTAIEYHSLHLKIAKDVRDKHGECVAYGNLGNVYRTLGDLINANDAYNLMLKIAKDIEDKSLEALAFYFLGCVFESLGRLPKAVEHYQASITVYNSLRVLLKSKDECKINFRNYHQGAYTGLWSVLVKQGNIDEALLAAEKGRAQALTDLLESRFCGGASQHKGSDEDLAVLKNVSSNTVFQAVGNAKLNLWVVSKGKQVRLRQSKLNGSLSENSGASQSFESLMLRVYTQLGVRSNARCEDRSLDALRKSHSKVDEKTKEDNPQPPIQQSECLSTLYDNVMKPVADLVQGDELVIIPDGPLWLAPYAVLKDGNSKYMCESFRIRLAPSLTSLRLIADSPDDYHKSSGVLLVGDPWVAEVADSKGEKPLEQLPFAKEEVEMIGKILNITPITGRQATKREVLKRLSSVSLVHFAAHGCMETGEIALTPDPDRISTVPTEDDYILTIGDVLTAQLRAKLVVLSCCHSGRGEVKAEGVVGIARAFMGAGARSVVVSLWAIDDEATLEFMKCFYQHLAEGKPASESLNLAMKSLRESDKFRDIKYWAPFSLIGDDVTLDFMAKKRKI